ncbi:SMI1/KNR4 family protein [Bacteroidota bacterium]
MNELGIDHTLARLEKLIQEGSCHCYFNKPADPNEIESLEKKHGFRLPDSFNSFLKKFNGGMIVNDSLEKIIQRDNDLETAKWNANNLLSTSEIEEEYTSMKSRNFGVAGQFGFTYPFIPLCKTFINEYLVFVNLGKEETESAVLDAYHEESPESWGLVAEDFNTFLVNYIETGGYPEVMGDETLGTAADLARKVIPEEPSGKPSEELPDEIIERTTAQIEDDPTNAWFYTERGLALHALGRNNEALADFNTSIELEDGDAFSYFARGVLFEDLNKSRAALIDFDSAVKLEPDDAYYLNCRARVLCDMEKYEPALSDMNRVIEMDEDYVLAYYTRERIYRALGENGKAHKDLMKIRELEEEKE